MDANTYSKLTTNGRNLVILKAVRSASPELDARPLAWIVLSPDGFNQDTTVTWTESYQAYTSQDQITSGAQVRVGNSYPIALGETFVVENPDGSGKVQSGGLPGAVFISNPRNRQPGEPQLTYGLMQTHNAAQGGEVSSPLCAFPLFPSSSQIIAPINNIFVIFASNIRSAGTVVEYTINSGIMLQYIDETSREIRFDVDKGFIPDHDEGSEIIEPTPDLARRLIL